MKKYLVFITLLLVMSASFAQPVKKTPAKEKTPTKKETDAMMKELQAAMDEMSPEEKKAMDSMGFKIPVMKDLPNLSDKQLADAFNEDNKIIPSKKTGLIAQLPKKIFSIPELASYVKTTNTSVASIIKPKSKELAERLMTQFKNDPYYGFMIASAANGMWVMGLKEPAVYLMGKATEILPNADNYNNYAAYLIMTGAGHMAIPILEKLNSIHKKNSTILNNLGEAWLQLGDADKAGKYLDSAIMVYAYHPQANYTKALILESQGKTAEAVVALKRSLKHSVTKSKLQKLDQLEKNQKTKPKYYIPKTYFSVSFDLGRYTAVLPTSYSMGIGMEIQQEWDFARQQLTDELNGLNAAIRMAKKQAEEETVKIGSKIMKYRNVGFSPYYYRALNAPPPASLTNEIQFERDMKQDIASLQELANLKSEYAKAIERYQDENHTVDCGEVPIVNKYIAAINKLNQTYRERKLRQWASDAYSNYNYMTSVAPTSGAALVSILEIKRDFVSKLLSLGHESYNLPGCASKEEQKKKTKKKLPDYDKVNCKTASSLYVPLTGQIVIRCNEMDVVFNPTYLPFKASWTENFNTNRIEEASVGVTIKAIDLTLSGKRDENGDFESGKISIGKNIKGVDISVNGEFDANGFTKGSVELGIDGALSLLPKTITEAAPVDISLKGELGVGLELGPEGISDFYVKEKTSLDMSATMEAEFATSGEETTGKINEIVNGADVQIQAPKVAAGASISADNRWGVNSGYSGKSSSEFSGLRVK